MGLIGRVVHASRSGGSKQACRSIVGIVGGVDILGSVEDMGDVSIVGGVGGLGVVGDVGVMDDWSGHGGGNEGN